MNYRWKVCPHRPLETACWSRELAISELLAQCLWNRGIVELEAASVFLTPRLRGLRDPFLLPDMDRAVARLRRARQQGERVAVFGDYDVDGVTSSVLLEETLDKLGIRTGAYLPDRLGEGYGLSREAVERCLDRFHPAVLLAVDCGSTAGKIIAWLSEQGVDVIVLDHHQISDLPPAVAVVNPQRLPDASAADRNLCSVGLAFKLAHALLKRARENGEAVAGEVDLREELDLVALGTIADLVPLTGENRVLTRAGLAALEKTKRPGLKKLKQVAGVNGAVGVYACAFQLGPRLNAAGRLDRAAEAMELLRASSETAADRLAQSLDAKNRKRQEIENGIAEQVIGAVRARFDPAADYVIVEGQLLWHIGVVGIVASRVLREFYRPTLIVGGEGRAWRGSGRSIPGFDLAAALRECDDLLERHGGHAMAAGITLQPENLEPLRDRLNRLAHQTLSPEALRPVLVLDAEATLGDLTLERLAELERLEPIGQGNLAVQLVARGLRLSRPPRIMGKGAKHLKLWVTDGRSEHEAVWWRGNGRPLPPERFDLAFAPEINRYNGCESPRLRWLDWRPA